MLRGLDDRETNGFIYQSIVLRLAKIVESTSPPQFLKEASLLRAGEFEISYFNDDDGGPNWKEFIKNEIETFKSRKCLEISWLLVM